MTRRLIVRSEAEADINGSRLVVHLWLSVTGDKVPDTSVPTPPGFDDLSKGEQVRYLQALCDQISEGPGALPASVVGFGCYAELNIMGVPRGSVPTLSRIIYLYSRILFENRHPSSEFQK